MKKVDADLLYHVMQILTEIYQDNQEMLKQHYVCMQVLLSRTGTINDTEKAKIKERLHMFQELFDGSPLIQEIRKVSHDQGLEEGIQQGLEQGIQQGIQNLQTVIVEVVQDSYPVLAEFARQQASHINDPKKLNKLIVQLTKASDANAIRSILEGETRA